MKVLLEILDDAAQLLAALDSIDDLRPETRERLRVLLEGLAEDSTRLLRGEAEEAVHAPTSGDRFEKRCREWLMQRSLEAIAAADYERAEHYLCEGAKAFPEDAEFLIHLGLVHWEQGLFEDAAKSYEGAMAAAFPVAADGEVDWRDPVHGSYLRAMEGRALALCRLDRHEEALGYFDALANMNRVDYDGCRYMAGEIRHMNGDIRGAIDDYRLSPLEPATLYNLGLAHFQNAESEASARTFIRAFVSNIHIVCLLTARRDTTQSCVPGYLGSSNYAEEFVRACGKLWEGEEAAVEFMAGCFDHPLVQSYLERCHEEGGDSMLESDPADQGQTTWLRVLTDESSVDGLAQSVVKRFNS